MLFPDDLSHRLDLLYRTWGTKLIHAVYHPTFLGFEKLPATGAALLACNHVSYMDGFLIAAACKRPVRFVIWAPIYRLPIIQHFMQINRAIPIEPTRASVTAALDAISAGLKAGDLVCIFPEGQLTLTGSMGRFKPGIEYILQRDPSPVYPVAITGLWGSIFSHKHRGSWKRYLLRDPRFPVRALCGDPLPGAHLSAQRLQAEIMKLKYRIQS